MQLGNYYKTFSPWSHLSPLYPGLQVHSPLTWLHVLLQPEEQFIKQPDPNRPSGHASIENTELVCCLALIDPIYFFNKFCTVTI